MCWGIGEALNARERCETDPAPMNDTRFGCTVIIRNWRDWRTFRWVYQASYTSVLRWQRWPGCPVSKYLPQQANVNNIRAFRLTWVWNPTKTVTNINNHTPSFGHPYIMWRLCCHAKLQKKPPLRNLSNQCQ